MSRFVDPRVSNHSNPSRSRVILPQSTQPSMVQGRRARLRSVLCGLLAFAEVTALRGPAASSTSRSVVSITSALIADLPLEVLESRGPPPALGRVARLGAPLCVDDAGVVGEATSSLQGIVGWVHVASEFKELVAARRAGATTIWLNEAAAATAGDLNTQGYFGTAIIDDFADAICADASELVDAATAARRARSMRKASAVDTDDNWNSRKCETDRARTPPAAVVPGGGVAASSAAAKAPSNDVRATTKFCIECGAQLPSRAKFCSACGATQ